MYHGYSSRQGVDDDFDQAGTKVQAVAGVSTSRNTAGKEINFFRLGQLIAAERPFALHTHPDKTRYSHVKIMPSIANDSRATSIT